MKYVKTDRNGRFRYRRGIPLGLRVYFGKREFNRVLGETENEARSKYSAVHNEFEKALTTIKQLNH